MKNTPLPIPKDKIDLPLLLPRQSQHFFCSSKLRFSSLPHTTSLYIGIFAALLVVLISCESVDSREFENRFKALADQRIQFRRSLKALGDSAFAQREYARRVVAASYADTGLSRYFAPEYVVYNDSLRNRMSEDLSFFEAQFDEEKPLIQGWEHLDMQFDRVVEKIKAGDLSEKEGLDSLTALDLQLKKVLARCDSDEVIGTKRYWIFRNTSIEYGQNMKNLLVLYRNEIYRK